MAAVTRLALLATLAATILPNSVSAQLCSEPIVHRNTRFVNGDQLQVNTTVTFAQCVQLCCDVDGERRYDLHRILQSARCSRTRASRPLPRVARGRRHSQCACCTRARSASSASSSNWPAAAPIHGRNPRSAWICASETRRLPMPCSERRSRAKRCKLPFHHYSTRCTTTQSSRRDDAFDIRSFGHSALSHILQHVRHVDRHRCLRRRVLSGAEHRTDHIADLAPAQRQEHHVRVGRESYGCWLVYATDDGPVGQRRRAATVHAARAVGKSSATCRLQSDVYHNSPTLKRQCHLCDVRECVSDSQCVLVRAIRPPIHSSRPPRTSRTHMRRR